MIKGNGFEGVFYLFNYNLTSKQSVLDLFHWGVNKAKIEIDMKIVFWKLTNL
jgi:hypothetical protein